MNTAIASRRNDLAWIDRQLAELPRLHQLDGDLIRIFFMTHSAPPLGSWPVIIAEAEAIVASGELERAGAVLAAASVPANRGEIGKHLATLIAAFPNVRRDASLQGYGEVLAADIADMEPTMFAIASACRRLRRTCKFLPSISEVLEAVREEESSLRYARRTIGKLPEDLERARQTAAMVLANPRAEHLIEHRERDDDDDAIELDAPSIADGDDDDDD